MLAFGIVIGHTVDDVPLQLVAFVEEGATEGQLCLGLLQLVLRVEQVILEGALHEVVSQRIEAHGRHRGLQTLIEGHGLVGEGCPPEVHVTAVHQILDLVLQVLYLLIGLPHLQGILLTLQVEFSLLGHIADGEGDIHQLPFLIVDGVYAQLGIAVHASVDDHALRTEVELFHMAVRQHIPEGGHVIEGVLVVIGVVLRLELQDLSHLLVGCQQVTVLVVEGQSHQRLLEGLAVFVGQLLFLTFLYDPFGLVCQCTEDVRGQLLSFYVFRDTLVVHIAPFPGMMLPTGIPAEDALCSPDMSSAQTDQEVAVDVLVLGVNILETVLIADA